MNIDSETFISWGFFGLVSVGFYSLYPITNYFLKKFSQKYNNYTLERKEYILTNIIKSKVLLLISGLFLSTVYDKSLDILTVRHSSGNYLFWKNISALYACTDFIGLIRNKKMETSTIIHHYCVLITYFVISMLDFRKESIFKAALMYGAFSALAFMVNFYLGARFLLEKHSKWDIVTKKVSAVSYILACAFNWTWQMYYMRVLYLNSNNIYNLLFQFSIYSTLLVAWISDDLKLMKFLLN
tara:strand:- start:132 stop:854 length:723 start_codon:yes stop_codon:yes gene_type:complete